MEPPSGPIRVPPPSDASHVRVLEALIHARRIRSSKLRRWLSARSRRVSIRETRVDVF